MQALHTHVATSKALFDLCRQSTLSLTAANDGTIGLALILGKMKGVRLA